MFVLSLSPQFIKVGKEEWFNARIGIIGKNFVARLSGLSGIFKVLTLIPVILHQYQSVQRLHTPGR